MHADDERTEPTFPDADAAVREREDAKQRGDINPGPPGGYSDETEPGDRPPSEGDPSTSPSHISSEDGLTPQVSGYAGRDPQTEMPQMSSVPETGGEPAEHGGQPDTDKPIKKPYGQH